MNKTVCRTICGLCIVWLCAIRYTKDIGKKNRSNTSHTGRSIQWATCWRKAENMKKKTVDTPHFSYHQPNNRKRNPELIENLYALNENWKTRASERVSERIKPIKCMLHLETRTKCKKMGNLLFARSEWQHSNMQLNDKAIKRNIMAVDNSQADISIGHTG